MLLFLAQPLLAQAEVLSRLPCERSGLGACCCSKAARAGSGKSCCCRRRPSAPAEQGPSLDRRGCDCLRRLPGPERLAAVQEVLREQQLVRAVIAAGGGAASLPPGPGLVPRHALDSACFAAGGFDPPLSLGCVRPAPVHRATRLLETGGIRALLAGLSVWRS